MRQILSCLMLSLLITSCSTVNNNQLQSHETRYQQLTQQAWPTITAKTPLSLEQESPAVPAIRARLHLLGDYKGTPSQSPLLDANLVSAVRFFQWRHGLPNTGVIDKKTLNTMNIDPAKRLQQIRESIKKWNTLPTNIGTKFIHVNIPAYEMSVVENGSKVLNMKVVVGRSNRPTPELYSLVKTIVLNPTWNVPRKLAAEDIIPNQMKDPSFLKKNNIKIYESWKNRNKTIDPSTLDWNQIWEQGFPYHFTQEPGNGNSLGKVKFLFDNPHGVYMHDTPKKYLFNKIKRAYSSGCIRLEKPFLLAEYFLRDNPNFDQETVQDILTSNKTKYIKLRTPIPVHITYITAWVDKQGHLHFREDIYKKASANSNASSEPPNNTEQGE